MTDMLSGLGLDLATHTGVYWLCFAGIFTFVTLLWVIGNFQNNHSLIDGFYGSMYATVGLVCFLMFDPNSLYSGLLLLMVCLHGYRLGYYLLKRWFGYRKVGTGDARYQGFVTNPLLKNGYWWKSFFVVMQPQTIVVMLVGLPAYFGVMVLADSDAGLNWVAALGLLLFGIGSYYEWLADGQLQAFKQNPENKGRYLEHGVWKLTRYPHYFGNTTVWWGIYLVAIGGSTELWWTIAGPLFNTVMLTLILGKGFQDRRYSTDTDKYKEILARPTNFLPNLKEL